MEEQAAVIQRLSRRVRTLNVLLSMYFLVMVASVVVLAILTIKVLAFINSTTSKINTIQSQVSNNVNFKQQICSDQSLSAFTSNICK